jgi:hypothetical protein
VLSTAGHYQRGCPVQQCEIAKGAGRAIKHAAEVDREGVRLNLMKRRKSCSPIRVEEVFRDRRLAFHSNEKPIFPRESRDAMQRARSSGGRTDLGPPAGVKPFRITTYNKN